MAFEMDELALEQILCRKAYGKKDRQLDDVGKSISVLQDLWISHITRVENGEGET
jgi:hypothetical protein